MRTKKITFLISFIGSIIIFCFGLFFKIKDLYTSGSSSGRTGIPGGIVVLDANSLFIIGTIILILSISIYPNKKKHEKEMEYLENVQFIKKRKKNRKSKSK